MVGINEYSLQLGGFSHFLHIEIFIKKHICNYFFILDILLCCINYKI
jgi:hypothetical protein